MALDQYITLGRSGLRVSPLCLGAMTFGQQQGWGCDALTSKAILDRFIDQGGNFIDTANVYSGGNSESIIGDHLGKHAEKRDRLVIATKFYGNAHPKDPNGGGAGRKSIVAACEESLKRLQTDYVDLYWMHAWDYNTPIEETMRALDDLVTAGKTRYIGFSDTPAWKVAQAQTIAQFRGWSPLIALQIEYSLLERTVEGELVPMARELGLGVTPWSPLKGGVLSGKYTRANAGTVKSDRGDRTASHLTEKTYALLDVLFAVANETVASPAAVALAWVQSQPGVASTILGVRSIEQLDANLSALEVHLTPAQKNLLAEASMPTLGFPMQFLKMAPMFMHGGLTVNGLTGGPPPWVTTISKEKR